MGETLSSIEKLAKGVPIVFINIFRIIYAQEFDIENSTEYLNDSTTIGFTTDDDLATVTTTIPYINVKVDLKYIKWANDSLIINKNLSIFGKMNENITAGIYQNADQYRQHAFSIYATYIDTSRNSSSSRRFQDRNSEIENICRNLASDRISNLKHMPLKDDIVHKIIDQGYTIIANNESDLWIKEFTENFQLDDWIINKNICFVFHKNEKTDDNFMDESYYNYLICVMPYFTAKQESLLYLKYLDEIGYINFVAYTNTISIVFMVITLIVYLLLPDLRHNVYGKCVVLYLATLIVGSTIYSIMVFNVGHLSAVCPAIGFLYQFFWLSNFTLQTVMCIDVYLTFSVMRSPLASKARNDKMKLFLYCLYAYSIPACHNLIFYVFQYTPLLDDNSPYKIKMEGDFCFLPISEKTRKARWVFLFGIYVSIIAVNCIIFMMTSFLLCRHSKTTQKFKGSFRKNSASKRGKSMIRVHFRLCFVMGMNWFLEIIVVIASNTGSPKSFVLRSIDTINSFVGIILFILLVCNKNVYRNLLTKFFKSSTTVRIIPSIKIKCEDQNPDNKAEKKSSSTNLTDINTDDANEGVRLSEQHQPATNNAVL